MKILSLTVEGFRSLKNVSWSPGDLNVIIGPNGSGKSNLLQLLELISVSAKGQLGKHVQRAGGMEPLVWDGKHESISFTVKATPVEEWRKVARDSLTYEVTLSRIGKTSAFTISHELLGNYYPAQHDGLAEPFKFLERARHKAVVFDQEKKSLRTTEELLPEDETLLSLASGPFSYNPYIPPFQAQIAGWCVYQDLHVNRDAPIRQAVVARFEKRVEGDGQNLISVLHTLYTGDREFKRNIDLAMRAAFGDDYEELVFPPVGDQKIQLRIRWKTLGTETSAADLSDGTLRFLFLLAVLSSPSPASLIAIDEPETGLHPSMLPIIAEHAVDAAQRTQIIFTTHSPQFLDAFDEIKPTTTVTKWENGESSLKVLSGKTLDYWLNEYSLGSLFQSGELEAME